MPYQLTWQTPDTILHLELTGHVSMEEFIQIDDRVNAYLDKRQTSNQVVLIIDAVGAQRVPQEIAQMKASQTYANRRDVKHLLIVTNKKQIRLIMLLTFNPCQAFLRFADNYEHGNRMLEGMHITSR